MVIRTLVLIPSLCLAAIAQEPPQATGRLEGVVVDALGEPVLLADVEVLGAATQDRVIARGKTDGSGMFVIGKVPLDDWWSVRARAKGLTEGSAFVRAPSGAHVVRLRLWDAARVTGRVVDADGVPVRGALVLAEYGSSRVIRDAVRATTDADGRYELDRVPLGTIDLRAWAPGYVLQTERREVGEDTEVELAPTRGEGVRIELTIEGLPADEWAHTRVRVLPYAEGGLMTLPQLQVEERLDDRGCWQGRGLPDWEFLVRPSHDSYSFQPREIRSEPGSETRNLGFRAFADQAVDLNGRVTDGSGKPLAGLDLVCRASSGGRQSTATTAADGSFRMHAPLAPGTQAVLYVLGEEWVTDQPLDAQDPLPDVRQLRWHRFVIDPTQPLAIRAVAATTVEGQLLDEQGAPVRFAPVTLQHQQTNRTPEWLDFAWAESDRDGRYRFVRMHGFDDPIRVAVEGEAGAGLSEPFRLQSGTLIRLDALQLRPPATIGGAVRSNGQLLPGVRVWLREWDIHNAKQRSGAVHEVLTNRAGEYRFVGVAPGEYRMQVRLGPRPPVDWPFDPFEVREGQRVTQDLTLPGR